MWYYILFYFILFYMTDMQQTTGCESLHRARQQQSCRRRPRPKMRKKSTGGFFRVPLIKFVCGVSMTQKCVYFRMLSPGQKQAARPTVIAFL